MERVQNNHDPRQKLVDLCKQGNEKEVIEMINQGVPVNFYDIYGETPLQIACFHCYFPIVSFLISKGADVNAPSLNIKISPLHCACIGGDVKIVKELIRSGANVNHEDFFGETPIFECIKGKKWLVEILIAHGADVDHKNHEGHTPLDKAMLYDDNPGIVTILRKALNLE